LLKKGRGLRKQRRSESEAPPTSDVSQEPAADETEPPSVVDEALDVGSAEGSGAGGEAVEAPAPSARPPEAATGEPEPEGDMEAEEPEATRDRVEALVSQAVDPDGIDDDEPPLVETGRGDPPPGPVLETRKLPEPPAGGLPPMQLPRVVAIANQKGGVGKTTTTVNLGAALAEIGFRVLVLDLDPQGNASTGLGLNPRDVEGSVYDVLLADASLDDIIEPTSLKNLFVAPATIDLAGAEIELVPVMSRELRLRKAIGEVKDDYDVVLIDCPPSLGLLTVNGLAASDDVIVPIQCEYYALEGLGQLLRNVGLVQANLNPGLDVRGIVLTMYDARTKLADQVVSEVRAYFGEKVYETVVPRTVRLSEAPSFGQPIVVFDPTSRGAKAYRELAKEVSRGASRRSG